MLPPRLSMIHCTELTLRSTDGYAPAMRHDRLTLWLILVSPIWMWLHAAGLVHAASEHSAPIPVEDYALYDQIVMKKFLTSDTRLVVLERVTVPHLLPDPDGPLTATLFEEQAYFGGDLPRDLIRDFVAVNQHAARLEGRFQFGVRYRFVSGNMVEEPEVRGALPASRRLARPAQAGPVLDRLAFSRVGRTLRNDQALTYAQNFRPDGTGAGFLIWFRRQGRDWSIYDTEVIWTIRESGPQEDPLLAP